MPPDLLPADMCVYNFADQKRRSGVRWDSSLPNTMNRLQTEKSPYLRQHENNPVDWYAWGAEAFAAARVQDKPIFLSVGYATCHWCHVMAHESFEDPDVAALMNDTFINIKVDREERPDVDGVYMTVCQMMTGSGGWPLTVLMTPDAQPFFAGTYIPKQSRGERMGLLDFIPRIQWAWQNDRERLLDSAQYVTEKLAEAVSVVPDETALSGQHVLLTYQQMTQRFDPEFGGFGDRPKFPTPHNLLFLLRYYKTRKDDFALTMVEDTLEEMRLGGIFDHVGFGFHRYSTDREWFLPHFEKMLYDQALLAMAYTEAFQVTGKPHFRQTAEEILTYVLRDLTDPDGGFYSAEDADSEGEEGRFYLWNQAEWAAACAELPPHRQAVVPILTEAFGIVPEGNAHDEASGNPTETNILALDDELTPELAEVWDELRAILFRRRKTRIHPLKDDKILTDWNGLMIAAMAKAGAVFGAYRYLEAAQQAANFLYTHLRTENGRLLHRFREGEAGLQAHLDDYAALIWGLTELYHATLETRWLAWAIDLQKQQDTHFWDEQNGGYFFTASDAEKLIVREKQLYDGALPSSNAMSLYNLIRLGKLTGDPVYEQQAWRLTYTFAAQIQAYPAGFTFFMLAADELFSGGNEVVLVGTRDEIAPFHAWLQTSYQPHTIVLWRNPQQPETDGLAPFSASYQTVGAYVCQRQTCQLPVSTVSELQAQLT